MAREGRDGARRGDGITSQYLRAGYSGRGEVLVELVPALVAVVVVVTNRRGRRHKPIFKEEIGSRTVAEVLGEPPEGPSQGRYSADAGALHRSFWSSKSRYRSWQFAHASATVSLTSTMASMLFDWAAL